METVVTLFADGGIKGGNPGGFGYGSFVVPRNDGVYPQRERLRFGHEYRGFPMTNIIAECLACIAAVHWIAERTPRPARVVVMCDCRWVVSHFASKHGRSHRDHLTMLHKEWKTACAPIEYVAIQWHSRVNSVAMLGH